MCRRVPEHVPTLIGSRGDDRDDGAIVERRRQIGLVPVDDRSDRGLLQTRADRGRQVERGGVGGQLSCGSVGEGDRDVRHGPARIRGHDRERREGLADDRGR